MRCGAKTRTGAPCQAHAMENGRCRMHGGGTPRGIANPNTKHGKFSKDLPTRMLADYEAELTDGELLNLSDAIALIRSRQKEIIRSLSTGGASAIWGELSETYGELMEAQRAKDKDQVSRSLKHIGELIRDGGADAKTWRELADLMEQERKLIDTEQKRRVAMQTMVTAEKGQLLVKALLASVNAHVSDKRILAAIGADIMGLVGDGVG